MDEQPKMVRIEAACKNCVAWQPVEEKGPVTVGSPARGLCFGVPPYPYPRFDKFGNHVGQMDLRPCPAGDNRCLLFSPRPDLINGADGLN